MKYRPLGATGLVVSRMAFGAMTFTQGNQNIAAIYKVGEQLATGLFGLALDAGVNLFDTADGYAGGESERLAGRRAGDRRRGNVGGMSRAGRHARRARRAASDEALRLPRTSRVQDLSRANKVRSHLADGAVQQVRDAEMARGSTDWSLKAIAWLYGHDAERSQARAS